MLEHTEKRYPTSKDKGEATVRRPEGAIALKSHPVPSRWATLILENNDTKEVLTLLGKVLSPMRGFPAWESERGAWESLGNPILKGSEI